MRKLKSLHFDDMLKTNMRYYAIYYLVFNNLKGQSGMDNSEISTTFVTLDAREKQESTKINTEK